MVCVCSDSFFTEQNSMRAQACVQLCKRLLALRRGCELIICERARDERSATCHARCLPRHYRTGAGNIRTVVKSACNFGVLLFGALHASNIVSACRQRVFAPCHRNMVVFLS